MKARGYSAKYLNGQRHPDEALASIRAHIDNGIPVRLKIDKSRLRAETDTIDYLREGFG